jgi:hypothetical protein
MQLIAFYRLQSATWSTGLIPLSSLKTIVRFLVIMWTRYRTGSHYSRSYQARSCHYRYLYVCSWLYTRNHAWASANNILSWETLFTAGFELEVLKGKRPYRWTIWVSYQPTIRYDHSWNWNSYILEHATPLCLRSFCSSLKQTLAKFPVMWVFHFPEFTGIVVTINLHFNTDTRDYRLCERALLGHLVFYPWNRLPWY